MKKQNILKKISLLVLSSIMTISGVLATPGETVAKGKHDKGPAYPKLTTKDAGKNPTTKTKKSSGGKFIGTAFATIGVLWTINKTHDLISALFGNPYFKIGMMLELSNIYEEDATLRRSLLSPDRDLMSVLHHFQRQPIVTNPTQQQPNNQNQLENSNDDDYVKQFPSTSVLGVQSDDNTEITAQTNKTQTTFPIFKGLVSKMTDEEIDELKTKGAIFATSNPVISKLLLKRFDVLLIDAFDSAAEKISSLFSSKSKYGYMNF